MKTIKRFLVSGVVALFLALSLGSHVAVATVGTTTNMTVGQGNGVTTTFSYNFIIPSASTAIITYTTPAGVATTLAPNQYTITGIGNTAGGTVTYPLMGSPIASGATLTIERLVPYTQTTSIANQGPTFRAIEGALDNLTYQTQQLANGGAGAVQIDAIFKIENAADNTKIAQFSAATIATGTTRTFAFPNQSGTLALTTGSAADITVGTTTVTGGTTTRVLYDNSGVLGEYTITGSGNVVLSASPTLSGTIAGTFTVGSGATWNGVKIGLAFGGTNADLSATGGTSQVLKQVTTGAAVTVGQLAQSDISGILGVANGGTGATLAATGGTSQVLKQASTGAVITVGTLACSDLSNGATGCSTATGTSGATIPLLNGANTWSGVQSFNSGDFVLKGASSGTITLNAPTAAGSNTLTLPAGTTDFSGTGGTSQVVKQTSAGGALTVAQLATTDLTGLGANVATWLATPTSANLAAAVTDETGSGAAVFATSPTLVTPVLGAATATSINKMMITAPASGSTLAVADGKTATVSNTLTFTGTDGATIPFGVRTRQVFTSGSGTYTTPTNVKYIVVRMVGGGAGGNGSSTLGGVPAIDGGTTTFGTSLLTAGGGVHEGGVGGTATGGDINITGGRGGGSNAQSVSGSPGGNSVFGGAGSSVVNGVGSDAAANSGSGGGGAGGTTGVTAAGSGSSGGYVEKLITVPNATYSYSVGAKGAKGAAGTGGTAGGDGGAGIIIVDEFYQ